MELDIDRNLGTVFGSRDRFIEKMLEVQDNVILRDDLSHWASHLRFIEVPIIDVSELDDFFRQARTLNLTNKNAYPGETNYLAVSYCWSSVENSESPQGRPPYSIQTTNGVRSVRAPRSVLERSISYAVTQGIRFIWIDQECIDQEDHLDLEQGVQCMDQVYRTAAHSIGLLSARIYSESTFRTFTRILSHARDKSIPRDHLWQTSWYDHTDPQILLEANRLLSGISTDRWFYRNWTYQEASCTQDRMHLLVPHIFDQQLVTTGGCPNEICFRLSELFEIVSMISNTTSRFLSRPPPRVDDIAMEAMGGLYVQAWDQRRRATRPQSYEVAEQMKYRDNLVVADRLAITSNLCEYAKRIDPRLLSIKQYSYSICALALALVNGVIIPSGRSNVFTSTGEPIYRWQDENIYDFLASPMYLSTAYAHPDRVEPRLRDVMIRREGLETSGWLWIIDKRVELRRVKEKNHHLLKKLQWPRKMEELTALLKAPLSDLLEELEQLNLPRIASTLRACIRIENSGAARSCSQGSLDEFTTESYYISHWFFDLIESLLVRGHLWCGRLDGEEELSSIFHCDTATMVFTSSEIRFQDITRPWLSQNFVSCEVIRKVWVAGGVTELVHTMETIHGVWHGVENASKRFLFPWGDK